MSSSIPGIRCFKKLAATRFFHDGKAPRPYYLDYQATTPIDPRVLDAMLPFHVDMYGNPHSRTHAFGWEAEHYVDQARSQVASLINASPQEIIFTSGATESNNLALKGLAAFYNKTKKKKHIITTEIEHKCILSACRDIQDFYNWDITYLKTDNQGIVDLEKLRQAIRPETAVVSVIAVNNEIGVLQPLKKIGEICKEKNVLFHTDAAQAFGKIPLDVKAMNIDLLSLSGHKIYGPKGIGALFLKKRHPRIRMVPIFSGGGQERGFRSGTVATHLAVGLGEAAKVAAKEMERDQSHVEKLAKRLYDKVTQNLTHVILNGSPDQRYKGNLNLSFAAVEGESLLMQLNNLAISSGSACTSASLEPSYILRAIGVGEDLAHTSLRFGFGRFTTEEEVDLCAEAVVEKVKLLREISPLWEVVDDEDAKQNLVWT